MLDEHLTLDQARAADALIDDSEFAPALETLAEWLAEQQTPVPDSIRLDFERLSERLANRDRVMPRLEGCPPARDPDS